MLCSWRSKNGQSVSAHVDAGNWNTLINYKRKGMNHQKDRRTDFILEKSTSSIPCASSLDT
jgi:hypothetical protein